jgi:hypothetical protein
VIDSVTPVLLIGFGLTRSVATLGVLAWRLVNFWLPIPTGAAAYISLKLPRGSSWADMRKALADMVRRNRNGEEDTGRPSTDNPSNPSTGDPGPDDPGPGSPPDGDGGTPATEEEDHAPDRA